MHDLFMPNGRVILSIKGGEPVPVDAEVSGIWAVHLAVGYSTRYVVSHVDTGLAAKKDLGLQEARDLARRLRTEAPIFNNLSGDAWIRSAAKIKEILHAR